MNFKGVLVQFLSVLLSFVLLGLLSKAIFYYLQPAPGTLLYALVVLTISFVTLILLFQLLSIILTTLGIGIGSQNILFLLLLIVVLAWFISPQLQQLIRDIFQ